jgi:hypothetical protein
MSALMWESFLEMKAGLDEVARSVSDGASQPHLELVPEPVPEVALEVATRAASVRKNSAQVLPFQRPPAHEDAS